MRFMGEICLLAAFVAFGFSAFACWFGAFRKLGNLQRNGQVSAIVGMLALTIVITVLACALLFKDFRFHYVAQYTSQLLPWYYSLSALWVGQAGS